MGNEAPVTAGDKDRTIQEETGRLYIVSTPLGNLEDITFRALRILKSVPLIAAESVGHTRILCGHYGVKTRLIRFNQHNQEAKGSELMRRLKSGMDIALVTNAGTPGISDPGAYLVSLALKEAIRVSPIPGPSAVSTALSVSGFRGERFLFYGFLSSKKQKRKKELLSLESLPYPIVFFEAPHRIRPMLEELSSIYGDREMVLLREMTKIFEQIKRGPAWTILQELDEVVLKGEFTLVVAGKRSSVEEGLLDEDMLKKIKRLLNSHGMSMRDVAKRLEEEYCLPYRKIYKACLSMKREDEREVAG